MQAYSWYINIYEGHYISVNKVAKVVMIASASWQFKIYMQALGYAGVRLEPLLYFQQPLNNVSICLQLESGYRDYLFYSLRACSENGKKRLKVHRITKKVQIFE